MNLFQPLRIFGARNSKRLLRDKSGNFAMLAAVVAVPLMVAAGGAVDLAGALALKTELQGAADAGALAGAAVGSDRHVDAAESFLAANLGGNSSEDLERSSRVHKIESAQGIVTVRLNQPYQTSFLGLIGMESIPVSVLARAKAQKRNDACIFALDPSKVEAFRLVNANTFRAECGIQVNSDNARALKIESSKFFSATTINVHGGSSVKQTLLPQPIDRSPVVPDPLAGIEEPQQKGKPCNFTALTIDSSSPATLNPGVYCKGLTVNSSAGLVLKPGVYVFRNGNFTLNASGTVKGEDVLLYFEDERSAFMSNGAAVLQLSAPTTGKLAGILMFQGRDAVGSSVIKRLNTADGSYYAGTIYLPHAAVEWNVSGSANVEAAYTALITKTLYMAVSGTVAFRKPPENSAVPVPPQLAGGGGPRLIQ